MHDPRCLLFYAQPLFFPFSVQLMKDGVQNSVIYTLSYKLVSLGGKGVHNS